MGTAAADLVNLRVHGLGESDAVLNALFNPGQLIVGLPVLGGGDIQLLRAFGKLFIGGLGRAQQQADLQLLALLRQDQVALCLLALLL